MKKYREQTVTNILEAAKKKFGESGYEGTSIQEIAKEADVNVAMASYYFNGKENLYYEVFKKYGLSKDIPNFLEINQSNPLYALRDFLTILISHRTKHPEIGTLAYHEIIRESPRLEIIKPHISGIFEQLIEILTEGKKQGVFHFLSVNHTVNWIMSMVLVPKLKKFIGSINPNTPINLEDDWTAEDMKNSIIFALTSSTKM
ncbi:MULTISPECIES: TetR/AcrR family transcriptional regulator [Bacillus cereus group]|uniref:TetR family transcriptional regulator n=1 Tax=Bacillus cereus VD118 TaxID=1053231 RepID=R8Q999_BACCE|nr:MULTISPECIES: TetR/AcrR family transcriptional regulator [Bacillus cereus group]EOP67414.1 TetR family transcriptional regulator [Bacillus cereus VD118]MBJ8095368.1 TetR/AcrR family transcriptional regulator [Bacillus cereus]MCQ6359499.1 TetR/AcrR family transcriptional regulator [Bacillus cereus]CAH2464421.1 transcriptional regulator [Bacillus mycoides KBAB4]